MVDKIKLIIKREYLTKVRRKSFVVMTVLGPLLFVGVFAIVAFLDSVKKEHKTIGIYDETSLFSETFPNDKKTSYVYFSGADIEEIIDTVKSREYLGLLHIPKNNTGDLEEISNSIEFLSKDIPLVSTTLSLRNKIEDRLMSLKLIDLGTSRDIVNKAKVEVSLKYKDYHGDTKNSYLGVIQVAIGGIAGMMIYMFIFIYGVQVMRSVIEEKTNRIVELVISSVKPFELMMGKIIGSALVGLTQFILWMIFSSVLMVSAKSFFGVETPSNKLASEVTPEISSKIQGIIMSLFEIDYGFIIIVFLFFFIGGYLLYSALFAAIGSAVDSETDTQQFMLPITLPLIIALYSAIIILEDPNGPVAFWMSMIPFTSPVVMMARIPFEVPMWQIITSMAILIIGFVLSTLFAAKIYKTGILMYGKKPTYKEIWKWIRY